MVGKLKVFREVNGFGEVKSFLGNLKIPWGASGSRAKPKYALYLCSLNGAHMSNRLINVCLGDDVLIPFCYRIW